MPAVLLHLRLAGCTPYTPWYVDEHIDRPCFCLLQKLSSTQTPLMGGEGPSIDGSDFSGITPRNALPATPHAFAGMTPGGGSGETPAGGRTVAGISATPRGSIAGTPLHTPGALVHSLSSYSIHVLLGHGKHVDCYIIMQVSDLLLPTARLHQCTEWAPRLLAQAAARAA